MVRFALSWWCVVWHVGLATRVTIVSYRTLPPYVRTDLLTQDLPPSSAQPGQIQIAPTHWPRQSQVCSLRLLSQSIIHWPSSTYIGHHPNYSSIAISILHLNCILYSNITSNISISSLLSIIYVRPTTSSLRWQQLVVDLVVMMGPLWLQLQG